MSRNIQSVNTDDNSSNSNEEEFYLFICEAEGDIYDDEIAKNSKENPWRKSYFYFLDNYIAKWYLYDFEEIDKVNFWKYKFNIILII